MPTPNERPKLRDFYNDVLTLHCAFGGMKPTAANWQDCYNAAQEIANKNGNSEFVCKLLSITLEQIEKEARK